MAKELLLVRHAQASAAKPGVDDFQRELAASGLDEISAVCALQPLQDLQPDWVCASPARRAWDTAKQFAGKLRWNPAILDARTEIYEADLHTLLTLLQAQRVERRRIALFGHNPAISLLAQELCPELRQSLSTCAVVHLELDTATWRELRSGNARLRGHYTP